MKGSGLCHRSFSVEKIFRAGEDGKPSAIFEPFHQD